jgi:hypothetical protein
VTTPINHFDTRTPAQHSVQRSEQQPLLDDRRVDLRAGAGAWDVERGAHLEDVPPEGFVS